MEKNEPLISVVIPVYNGALYLDKTFKSLMDQTYKNFEVIFVNDSSTDNSLSLLEKYSQFSKKIKVFTKPNGGFASKAVNYGLKYASGKYFMYSSQDDLFSPNLLEKNIQRALETDADSIVPYMRYYHDETNNQHGISGINGDINREINGREAFTLSLDWTIHGFALWSMELVRKVGIAETGLNSDEYSTRMLFFNSKKVVFSDGVFYYRQQPNAITRKWNLAQLDYVTTCNQLEMFLVENNFGEKEIQKNRKCLSGELIRIIRLYKSASATMSIQQRIDALQTIKEAYEGNKAKIRKAKSLRIRINLSIWTMLNALNNLLTIIQGRK